MRWKYHAGQDIRDRHERLQDGWLPGVEGSTAH